MASWFKFGHSGQGPSRARIIQVTACAALAWLWFHSEPFEVAAPAKADASPGTNSLTTQPRLPAPQIEIPAENPATHASLFSSPMALGASTIQVVVSRNDTLDRIFRRLKLDVADLASLRDLPGLKAGLDRLRPGE